jgi:hypothetical protein
MLGVQRGHNASGSILEDLSGLTYPDPEGLSGLSSVLQPHFTPEDFISQPEWAQESGQPEEISYVPQKPLTFLSEGEYSRALFRQKSDTVPRQAKTELITYTECTTVSLQRIMESLDEPNYASAACIWSLYICSRELLRTLHGKVLDKAHISRDLSSAERNLKDEVIRLSLWGKNRSAQHVVITLALSREIQVTAATFLLNIATILTKRKSAHASLHRITEQLLELIPLIGEKKAMDLISEPTQVFYRQLEDNLGEQTYRLELKPDLKGIMPLDALVNARRDIPSSSVEGLPRVKRYGSLAGRIPRYH